MSLPGESPDNPIVRRFSTPKQHQVRYVEDRLTAVLREISRFRSPSIAWESFDRFGKVSADEEGVFRDFEHFLRLAEAYYKQYRTSDEIVGALPLYYGSMWLSRAIIAQHYYADELGQGLKTHGMSTEFLDIEELDNESIADEIEVIVGGAKVHARPGGRLTILSQALAGDDISGRTFGLGELLSCIPELSETNYCRHPFVRPRTEDSYGFNKQTATFTTCGFDYWVPRPSVNPDVDCIDFDKDIALAPVFRARNAIITGQQVHLDCNTPGPFDDLYDLTITTPEGMFLERRLRDGSYLPEMAVHLAIQHALSELVRYHPMTWLAMADANTEEFILVRNFMEISSRKFPHLVLNELAWTTYDFRRA